MKCRWITKGKNAKRLDSLTVIPESVSATDPYGKQVHFLYNIARNNILFPDSLFPDSVQVCYRTLPFQLGTKNFNRDLTVLDTARKYRDRSYTSADNRRIDTREELFATQGLSKTGNISRGVSFGNTQNVVVNSSLNLQMEGKLSHDLKLKAAISDQNLPIQPDGNTASLQSFDRVYIQLEHGKSKLIAGDLQLRNRPDSYFLKYFKNVQGGLIDAWYETKKGYASNTFSGVSIAKGLFASILLTVSEGVQGPYRLTGPNGEQYVLVLANTEKVYLDGRLLQRGFSNDYIIDYNQGTVTFTSNVVITQFSRVRVDYEYSSQNYNRTIIAAGHYQDIKNGNVYFNYYSQRDDPNNPNVNVNNLTNADKLLLNNIGDTINKALINSATTTTYNVNQILYRRTDTLVPGTNTRDSVYVYSTNPSLAIYQVSFTDMGQGNGNYIYVPSTTNGIIYQWIAPVNGVLQGRYEPVQLLVTPKRNDMMTTGGNYDLSKSDKISGELALSNNDVNLYSTQGKSNDHGFAGKFGYTNKGRPLWRKHGYRWTSSLDYEYDNKNFAPIDRFRYIEFDRDWSAPTNSQVTNNLNVNLNPPSDHILNSAIGAKKDDLNKINYSLSWRNRTGQVDGYQHRLDAAKSIGKLQLSGDLFFMKNTQQTFHSGWERYNLTAVFKNNFLLPGYTYSVDHNTIRSPVHDSITSTAMYYEQHKVFIKTLDSSKTTFSADYAIRNDHLPIAGELATATRSYTANTIARRKINKSHDLRLNGTYRDLISLRDTSSSGKSQQTIMGRFDYLADFFKNHVKSELTYTSTTGREFKKQYVYVAVASGQGDYIWIDVNNDGIQELNEFYPKVLSGYPVEYIKTYVPTSQYVKAYGSTLSYRLNVSAPRNWKSLGGIKEFISRFSNTTSWASDKKTTSPVFNNRFIPFLQSNKDSLTSSSNLRTTFFYNRTNPRYGIDFVYLNTYQRQFLVNGFERRNTVEYTVNNRLSLHNLFNLRLTLTQNFKGSGSDYLPTSNYLVRGYIFKPELSYQPSQTFRFTTSITASFKENLQPTDATKPEGARDLECSFDTRITQLSNRTITANVKYINNSTTNLVNFSSPVGYELLNALSPGNNFTWSLIWQQKLANGLQISINYEGRKSENTGVVNTGRMQVSALF